MAMYRCSSGKIKTPILTKMYFGNASSSTNQIDVHTQLVLNGQYKTMNITIGSTNYWQPLTINGNKYAQGTHNINIDNVGTLTISERIHAGNIVNTTNYIINSIK